MRRFGRGGTAARSVSASFSIVVNFSFVSSGFPCRRAPPSWDSPWARAAACPPPIRSRVMVRRPRRDIVAVVVLAVLGVGLAALGFWALLSAVSPGGGAP